MSLSVKCHAGHDNQFQQTEVFERRTRRLQDAECPLAKRLRSVVAPHLYFVAHHHGQPDLLAEWEDALQPFRSLRFVRKTVEEHDVVGYAESRMRNQPAPKNFRLLAACCRRHGAKPLLHRSAKRGLGVEHALAKGNFGVDFLPV